MHEKRIVGLLLIALFVICFTLLVVSTAQAYSYNDYYEGDYNEDYNWDDEHDWRDDDEDELEYYDHRTGQWKTIPEPDPYYPVGYGHHRASSPISVMMPLFIFFFVLLPWLAYALVKSDE